MGPYEVKLVDDQLINKRNYFSLLYLNQLIAYRPYGTTDIKGKANTDKKNWQNARREPITAANGNAILLSAEVAAIDGR